MITIRRSEDRGHADHGWLDSHHTFSFANYYDPEHMGFRSLRVINEDRVREGAGFGKHSHRDMEIISIVLEGSLAHEDSMGNGSVLTAGDVQRMSAGTGVIHSEVNPSSSEPAHFLQIWITPEKTGLKPSYEEANFSSDDKRNRLRLIAAKHPTDGALTVHQDVALYGSVLEPGTSVTHELAPGRHAWAQVIRGDVTLNGERLSTGDGAAVRGERSLTLAANGSEAELLLFDLA